MEDTNKFILTVENSFSSLNDIFIELSIISVIGYDKMTIYKNESITFSISLNVGYMFDVEVRKIDYGKFIYDTLYPYQNMFCFRWEDDNLYAICNKIKVFIGVSDGLDSIYVYRNINYPEGFNESIVRYMKLNGKWKATLINDETIHLQALVHSELSTLLNFGE